jgi:hypothetical protein
MPLGRIDVLSVINWGLVFVKTLSKRYELAQPHSAHWPDSQ